MCVCLYMYVRTLILPVYLIFYIDNDDDDDDVELSNVTDSLIKKGERSMGHNSRDRLQSSR